MAEEPFRPDPAAQAEALRRMGARIAARRKALGLTQKQLAARLLVSDKTVSKWELGGSCPDPALLVPLARTLGLTVDELLTGEAPPAPHNAPPAGESPAAGKPPAPEPDGWLGWRLDQKAAGISLLGLLLGGAGYSLFLPMQSLLGGQVGWVPAGLVVVAAVALLLAAGSWYRGQCRALGAASRSLPGLALCWLAALAPVFLLAGRLTTGQTGAWYRLPRGLTADQLFAGGQAPAWLTGLSAALPAAVLLLPLAMLAAAAALYLYAAGRQARPGWLLPALPGLLLAQGACPRTRSRPFICRRCWRLAASGWQFAWPWLPGRRADTAVPPGGCCPPGRFCSCCPRRRTLPRCGPACAFAPTARRTATWLTGRSIPPCRYCWPAAPRCLPAAGPLPTSRRPPGSEPAPGRFCFFFSKRKIRVYLTNPQHGSILLKSSGCCGSMPCIRCFLANFQHFRLIRYTLMLLYNGAYLFCITIGVIEGKLSVVHRWKQMQAAFFQCFMEFFRRKQDAFVFPLSGKQMDFCSALSKRLLHAIQGAFLQERDQVLPGDAAAVPIVVPEQFRLYPKRAELQFGKPLFPDQPVTASKRRPNQRIRQLGGDHRCALDHGKTADVFSLRQHFKQYLPAKRQPADQQDRTA